MHISEASVRFDELVQLVYNNAVNNVQILAQTDRLAS